MSNFKTKTTYKVVVTRVCEGILPYRGYGPIGTKIGEDGKEEQKYGSFDEEKFQRVESSIFTFESPRCPKLERLTQLMVGKL